MPEGLAPPTVVLITHGYSFSWQLPTHPNGIITRFTLYIGSSAIYNGTALSANITGVVVTSPQTYFLEAHNSAGTAVSETRTLDPFPEVSDPEVTIVGLTIGQAVGVIVAVATILLVVLLLLMFVTTVSRLRKKDKPPAFLSHDFEVEKARVVCFILSTNFQIAIFIMYVSMVM